MTAATSSSDRASESEAIRLGGGDRLRLRPVRPADKGRFLRAFGRLSSLSRYRRFHAHKHHLSDADLRFFTEVDGRDHFALVAVEQDASGREGEAVGSARYIRLPEQPDTAEIAVAVVDSHQGRGIGKLLLERLLREAFENGIRRIRVYLLAENVPIRKLLENVFGPCELARDGDVVSGELPLDSPAPHKDRSARTPIFELLRLAAEEAVLPVNLSLMLSRTQLAAMKRRLASRTRRRRFKTR